MHSSSSASQDGTVDDDIESSCRIPLNTTKSIMNEAEIYSKDMEDGMNNSEKKPAPGGESAKSRKNGLSFLLVFSTVSVTLGQSMLGGYNTAVLSVPSVHMKEFFNESYHHRSGDYLEENAVRWLWSFTVSFLCIGAAVGALFSGYPSNKFGRKKTIMMNNAFSIVGASIISFSFLAHSYEMIMIGRFLLGVNLGIASAVVPMYLTEISPTVLRGAITIMHAVQLNIGIALSQALGLYVFTGEDSWPWLLGPPVIITSIFQLTTGLFCPQSPRWLYIKKNKTQSAIRALRRLRTSKDLRREISDMDEERLREKSLEVVGILDLLRSRDSEWRRPLLLTVICNCCVHLTGANAIWFYLVDIFLSAGLSERSIGFITVWLGIGNAIVTVLSGYCFDRFGRRPIIIGALTSCIVILCSLTLCMQFQTHYSWLPWISAALIAGHTFMVSFGPGPAPFVLCTEIWSQGPRSSAMALGAQVSWTTNFAVGLLFPTLQAFLGAYCFLLFAGILTVILIYFWIALPETRNKTFEEIVCNFKKETGLKQNGEATDLYARIPLGKSDMDSIGEVRV